MLCVFMLSNVAYAKDEIEKYEYTEDEIYEIASLMCVEARTQSDLGKKLVVDVVLNRVDSDEFPNTLEKVLTQKNQFKEVRGTPTEEEINLVLEEINERTNSDVLFFKTKNYHSFAVPVIQEGKHYFSGLNS